MFPAEVDRPAAKPLGLTWGHEGEEGICACRSLGPEHPRPHPGQGHGSVTAMQMPGRDEG